MHKICEILAELLEVDASEVDFEMKFRCHKGWDSLAALGLITAVEDEFGIVLSDSTLRNIVTVRELVEVVSRPSVKG